MKTVARIVSVEVPKERAKEQATITHLDAWKAGLSIGPISVNSGAVYLWLNSEHHGEPIIIGPGGSITITCEYEP